MNKIKRIIIGLLIIPLFATNTFVTFGQSVGSDPAITDVSIIPSAPSPGQEVDFIVSYGNAKSGVAENVELIIDYNENRLVNISVGNTEHCLDSDVTIRCYFNEIPGNSVGTIGFTATVEPTLKNGIDVITTVSISQQDIESDVVQNNFKTASFIVSGTAASFSGQTGLNAALGLTGDFNLDEPSVNQGVALFDVQNDPNWGFSNLITGGLKFMIRGKEALAWTLNIKDSGFHNPAIQSSYLKVLTVVNSLFIIGLLAIAAMWMFSILIPRKYLRQVVLIYGLAVIFVNFALPINQLLIDGTGLLQKTFMSGVEISNIAETPSYNDENAVGYQNETNVLKRSANKEIGLKFSAGETPEGEALPTSITIGQLEQDFLAPSYTGDISGGDADQIIELRSTGNGLKVQVPLSQSIELIDEKSFNPDLENIIFAALMAFLTGLAYFAMSLIFLLRIVILWSLMIVSPILFLLGIFRFTRSYFYNWMGIYARWLLIGPLMALGIAIVVNIWQAVGLPISSAYPGFGEFGALSNIGFYLPGSQTVNTLNTTPQMMEYVLFLVMLYLPVVLAFMLTRQRMWSGATAIIGDKAQKIKSSFSTLSERTSEKSGIKEGASETKKLTEGIKGFFGSSLSQFNQSTLPASMKNLNRAKTNSAETAHSFLPEHLGISKMRDLLDLTAGDEKGSRNAHKTAVENMAAPENISDKIKQQQVMAVRQEISERANRGDGDAARVMSEIHEIEAQVKGESNTYLPPTNTIHEKETAVAQPSQVQVSVKVQPDEKKTETTHLNPQKDRLKIKMKDPDGENNEDNPESKESEKEEDDDNKNRKSRRQTNKKKKSNE